MLSRITLNFECEKFYLRVWLIFFIVTLFIIFLVQLILLPFIFSSWHAGNGLLVGGDWIGFHQEAVEMAQRIKDQGWSAWELWPKGWFPAGVAGALYALTWPAPWVLAPLNAAVHAFTGLIVLKILNIFTQKKDIDIVAAIPFIFFPSAMLWYTQIHRDGYNILGMLLFIYGLLLIIRYDEIQIKNKNFELKGLIISMVGIVLLWMSRPHTLIIFQYTGSILFFFVVIAFTIMLVKKSIYWKNALFKLFIFALALSLITPFTKTERADKYQKEFGVYNKNNLEINNSMEAQEQQLWASTAGIIGLYKPAEEDHESTVRREEDLIWYRTPWLPSSIDNHLYSIAVTRQVLYPMAYGESAINIDKDVEFSSAIDFIYYLPRALQIAFLAPFPEDWSAEGSRQTTTFFRRISALEMAIVYFFLLPMVCSLWIWRKKIEVYILFIFCTAMMLPIIYSVPNLGTIYRYRYGYLMLLVCLGAAVFYQFVKDRIIKKANSSHANSPLGVNNSLEER